MSLDEFHLAFPNIGSDEVSLKFMYKKIGKKRHDRVGRGGGKVGDVGSWTSGIKQCWRVIESVVSTK